MIVQAVKDGLDGELILSLEQENEECIGTDEKSIQRYVRSGREVDRRRSHRVPLTKQMRVRWRSNH